jgi:hypothetical protein
MIEGIPDGYSAFISHIHTPASDGMVGTMDTFAALSKFRDTQKINVIAAITDHDTFRGIRDAEKAAVHFGVPMVIGEEITVGKTLNPKHLLTYWEEEPEIPIPFGRCAEGTIDAICESGGIAVPAHANAYKGMGSFTKHEIRNFQNRDLLSGIESINGSTDRGPGLVSTVAELRKDQPFALFAGSDSHFGGRDLFRSVTLFKGKNVHDLFEGIKKGETIPLLLNGMEQRVGLGEKIMQNWKANVLLNIDRYAKKNL